MRPIPLGVTALVGFAMSIAPAAAAPDHLDASADMPIFTIQSATDGSCVDGNVALTNGYGQPWRSAGDYAASVSRSQALTGLWFHNACDSPVTIQGWGLQEEQPVRLFPGLSGEYKVTTGARAIQVRVSGSATFLVDAD